MVEDAPKPEDRRYITEAQYGVLVRALSIIPVSGPVQVRALQTAFEILDVLDKQEIVPEKKPRKKATEGV